jgi:hypothetical protein
MPGAAVVVLTLGEPNAAQEGQPGRGWALRREINTLIEESVLLAACAGPGPLPAPATALLSIASDIAMASSDSAIADGSCIRAEADVVWRAPGTCSVLVGLTGDDGTAVGWAVGRVNLVSWAADGGAGAAAPTSSSDPSAPSATGREAP